MSIAQPKVVIPVFPGTNCEYDSAFAFEKAGAKATIQVLRNLTLNDIDESLKELEKTSSVLFLFVLSVFLKIKRF